MTIGKLVSALALFLIFHSFVSAQSIYNDAAKKRWVDSVYNKLNEQERIGQLFMVAAYSGGKDYNQDKILSLIEAHQIGGLIFMQGTPEAQAVQNNAYQRLAQVPLLIGMDAEWGLGMRLTGVKDLPRSMMIGATRDTELAYSVGAAIAAQCKRLGVHINFGPVVDVNNNPDNPIINARSYGENKKWVARLGAAYARGLQDNGVMACAKHFPGHGDTKTDSHMDLPRITKSMRELDTLELYPFRELIKNGVKSMMVAHLEVPALETEPHVPTTLSRNTITNLLKNKMGFRGLVFTDALDMKGVTKYFEEGEVDMRAFIAGNDMLLFSQNVPIAIAKIKNALDADPALRPQLENSVKKILAAKYDMGLANWRPVNEYNVTEDINKVVYPVKAAVANAAITLVRDRNSILDKLIMKKSRVGYIGVNADDSTVLYSELKSTLSTLNTKWLPAGRSQTYIDNIEKTIGYNELTIVAVHNMKFYPGGGNYGLDERQVAFLKNLQKRKDIMIVLMGNAYWLRNVCNAGSLTVAYEDDSITQQAVAKVLLKEEDAKGILPVTPCPGMTTEGRIMLAKTKPAASGNLKQTDFAEDAGVVNPDALDKLDMFIQRSIVEGAFPGCRVLAAKNGKVFYNKAFGYYTYKKDTAVDLNTIYDVASMTKVLSTTLAVMRLYETGKLNLDKTIGDYLPWTRGTDKASLQIKNLLLHQAGLKSWIPFYKETLDESGNLRTDLYSHAKGGSFNIEVAKDLFLRNDYPDTIWSRVLNSPLENKGRYVYSDLDFYFLASIVQQITGQRIDKYAEEQFYKPMGLRNIAFNPLQKFSASRITPTENDAVFRHQQIRGYVHDQGAALFGGVQGHAGLFATADDVAAIFQMLLNKGSYNNRQYFKKQTVEYFTAYNSHISRRGLGFDKSAPDKDDAGPTGNRCSGYTFGHQGFTGTCVWTDPATGIIFVFLSNRVYPSADNNKINHLSVRTNAQDYIYEALGIAVNHDRKDVYKKQIKGK
jgi:beta-N-acetylhexosaminidase